MSRIEERFHVLATAGRKALVSFITAGDPEPSVTVPLMHAMVRSGVDILELGVPFSDPMADGPVIQRASERALARGMSLKRVLEMVREFRRADPDTPVVLMGYLNPVEVMGYEAFAAAAAQAGADGVLTVDLPPEEADDLVAALRRHGVDPIFLLAPTSTPERIRIICDHASGFVYYVSLKGVTGSSRLDVAAVQDKLRRIRELTDLPIGVGFGIRDAESAARLARVADAVVVGSVLVRTMEELAARPERIPEAVAAQLSSMRTAMDADLGATEGL